MNTEAPLETRECSKKRKNILVGFIFKSWNIDLLLSHWTMENMDIFPGYEEKLLVCKARSSRGSDHEVRGLYSYSVLFMNAFTTAIPVLLESKVCEPVYLSL